APAAAPLLALDGRDPGLPVAALAAGRQSHDLTTGSAPGGVGQGEPDARARTDGATRREGSRSASCRPGAATQARPRYTPRPSGGGGTGFLRAISRPPEALAPSRSAPSPCTCWPYEPGRGRRCAVRHR